MYVALASDGLAREARGECENDASVRSSLQPFSTASPPLEPTTRAAANASPSRARAHSNTFMNGFSSQQRIEHSSQQRIERCEIHRSLDERRARSARRRERERERD